MSTATAITRSSTGLVDALFASMDKLNAKEIDAEHARALSHTAKSIVAIAHLELESRKFRAEVLTENGEVLTSLLIENTKENDRNPA